MSVIKKIEGDDKVTIVDEDTGAKGKGSTITVALIDLAVELQNVTGQAISADDTENLAEIAEMTAETQKRFDKEDVEESDVEDAVEWARRQRR